MAERKFFLTAQELRTLYHTQELSLKQIGAMYDVCNQTVLAWMRKYDIPRRRSGGRTNARRVNGRVEKLCRGPSHSEPVYLPISKFRSDGKGRTYYRCRACETYASGGEPLVPMSDAYRAFLTSIINRIGKMETSRRLGISQQALWQLGRGKRKKMRRSTARSIVTLYAELKASGEVRHKDSIHHGAAMRGHKEKVPTKRKHLYRKDGDIDTERKRASRKHGNATN